MSAKTVNMWTWRFIGVAASRADTRSSARSSSTSTCATTPDCSNGSPSCAVRGSRRVRSRPGSMRKASGAEGGRGLHGDVGEEVDVAPGAERRREGRGATGEGRMVGVRPARELGVSGGKLRDWAGRGWLHARRGSAHGLWIIWADRRERDRLRKLVTHSRRGAVDYPASMTEPNSKGKQR